jgi:hypothetical protein
VARNVEGDPGVFSNEAGDEFVTPEADFSGACRSVEVALVGKRDAGGVVLRVLAEVDSAGYVLFRDCDVFAAGGLDVEDEDLALELEGGWQSRWPQSSRVSIWAGMGTGCGRFEFARKFLAYA